MSSLVSVCRDVIVRAVTGSGKTLAFAVPIIHILSNRQVFVLGEEVGRECLSFDSSPHIVERLLVVHCGDYFHCRGV